MRKAGKAARLERTYANKVAHEAVEKRRKRSKNKKIKKIKEK